MTYQRLTHHARGGVHAAAWCVADHDAHRFRRIALGKRVARRERKHEREKCDGYFIYCLLDGYYFMFETRTRINLPHAGFFSNGPSSAL